MSVDGYKFEKMYELSYEMIYDENSPYKVEPTDIAFNEKELVARYEEIFTKYEDFVYEACGYCEDLYCSIPINDKQKAAFAWTVQFFEETDPNDPNYYDDYDDGKFYGHIDFVNNDYEITYESIASSNNSYCVSSNIPHCPTCNSANVSKISTGKKALGFATFGIFSSNLGKQFQCGNCGYKW